jgi:hypothetical protein
MTGGEGKAGAGDVGRNLDLFWVDLPCDLSRSSFLRGRVGSGGGSSLRCRRISRASS